MIKMKTIISIIFTALFTLSLTSCLDSISKNTQKIAEKVFPKGYKSDILQGSQLDAQQVAQLKVGMSKTQIKKLIGSPDIIDPFRKNRWDYVNYSRVNEELVHNNLILLFNDDNTLIEIKK
jgi:outer membrane protein assembly factor BamE (lipoprotein component of BamABCDE complex)